MIDNSFTVATQACQLWFKKALELTPPALRVGSTARTRSRAAYVEPLDTHSDMSHLMTCERWPTADGRQHRVFLRPAARAAAA